MPPDIKHISERKKLRLKSSSRCSLEISPVDTQSHRPVVRAFHPHCETYNIVQRVVWIGYFDGTTFVYKVLLYAWDCDSF